MLKWLRQKPSSDSRGQDAIENVTDDPLAIISVQGGKSNGGSNKKLAKHTGSHSSSGSSEIYAVSRVNPLFEEEENTSVERGGGRSDKKGQGELPSPGNHSGSSGYDSGPSDDDSLNKKLQYDYVNNLNEASNHLFLNQEDVIIHHEATIVDGGENYLTANGRPILQILSQNPNFVKNIAVAANRPLTPIDESIRDSAAPKGRKLVNSSIPIPSRTVTTKPGDSLGAAKVLQRNKNYVQSIRIGPGPATADGQFQRRRQNFEYPSTSTGVGRKPSVTFSEKIDFVDGRIAGSRKTSSEQDSIVTESLLLMTSQQHQNAHPLSTQDLLLREVRARRQRILNKSEIDDGGVTRPDLTDLSHSLSKNRIVQLSRQIGSNGPHPEMTEHHKNNQGSDYDDDEDEDVNDEDHYNSGERSDSSTSAKSQTSSSRRARSVASNSSTNKSAFGGIADHYAAAKEIAKEIESYSAAASASGKSTGISLVRDLLLSKSGRSHSSSTSSSFSFKQNQKEQRENGNRFGPGTLVSTVVQVQPTGGLGQPGVSTNFRTADKPWLHPHSQVYVKASRMTPTSDDHPSGRRRDGEDEGQDQVPIYEILSGAARLRHEDSDSGNSTDRSPKESDTRSEELDDSESERHFNVETMDPTNSSSETNPQNLPSDKSTSKGELSRASSSSGSNNDKVMIVTGDSQNMVVDLSAVPLDLREAIISGTTLMTFPDGLRQLVEPGYTMITISDDEHHSPIRNDDYGTKNKTQFWDTLQQHGSSGAGSKDFSRKNKKHLTHLPFHPNHDSHTTPDFTMDGHRLAVQARKMKNGKKRRCLCRICGIIFFLAAFLGVIVTLSLIYTNGQRYFGSA